MILSIDLGSTITDIVYLDNNTITKSTFIKSKDFKTESLDLTNITHIYATGCGAKDLPNNINNIEIRTIDEIKAIGRGGLKVSNTKKALIVNIGSGTCMVSAENNNYEHIGGTPIGGATLMGLGKLILNTDNIEEIQALAKHGNLDNIDLTLKKIYPEGIGKLNPDATASHFGNLKEANNNDKALALLNMLAQTVGSLALFAAKAHNHDNIILTGRVATLETIQEIIKTRINTFSKAEVKIPKNAEHATVLGTIQ